MTFDSPGTYEWHSRTLPVLGSIAPDHVGGGVIFILPNDIDGLSIEDKHEIGVAILQKSEIPWSEMWSNEKGIMMHFNRAICDVLPDTGKYYTQRAHNLFHLMSL